MLINLINWFYYNFIEQVILSVLLAAVIVSRAPVAQPDEAAAASYDSTDDLTRTFKKKKGFGGLGGFGGYPGAGGLG